MARQCPPGTAAYTVKAGDTFFKLAQEFKTTVNAITAVNPQVNPNALRVGEVICIPGGAVRPACPGGNDYTIKAGDTLFKIAKTFNISVNDLTGANPGIDPNRLQVGQVICIPVATAPVTCPAGTASYTIKSGDTFVKLARESDTTVDAIRNANPGVNPDALLIGQKICLPGPSHHATAAESLEQSPVSEPEQLTTCPTGSFSYTVKAGDTLYALAQKYNTTVDAILKLNPGINPNALQIGQQICIPGQPPTTCPSGSFSYTIKAGDTLFSLAQRYNTTVDAILKLNPGINPNALQIGQQICIPGQPPTTCPSGSFSYTIKAGDTLFALAQRYNTTVDAIVRLNPGLNPNALQIGQQICIPGQPPTTCPSGSITYTVKAGDTLSTIAQRHNTTVEAILLENPGLNPNALQIGQVICLPQAKLIYANRQYKVVFLYPAGWRQVNPERYEGPDGFFQIGAIGGTNATLDGVCRDEAHHVRNPYGTNPTISGATIDGREACFIYPSADQPAEMNNQAALIVRYPQPVQINGQTYQFFILWADKTHLPELAATLEFMP